MARHSVGANRAGRGSAEKAPNASGAAGNPPAVSGVAGSAPGRTVGTLAVSTTGLSKRFDQRAVVDELALAIPAGSVCGFVGPNGAGKTTTIRMLLGLIRPSSGSGFVLGGDLSDPPSYLDKVERWASRPPSTATEPPWTTSESWCGWDESRPDPSTTCSDGSAWPNGPGTATGRSRWA